MGKKPYIEFYPGDWLRDSGVSMLSLEEKGAWMDVIIAMDDHKPRGELRGTVQGFARLWGVDDLKGFEILDALISNNICNIKWGSRTDKREWDDFHITLSEDCPNYVPFFSLKITNRRMKREEAKKKKWREEKKEQRGDLSEECPPDVQEVSVESPASRARSSSSSSSNINKKTKQKNGDPDYTEDFIAFWNLYPRKLGKVATFKCWKTRLKEGVLGKDLISASKNYAKSVKGRIPEHIKLPTTFIGPQRFFEDYINGDPEIDNSPRCGLCDNGPPGDSTGGVVSSYCSTKMKTVRSSDQICSDKPGGYKRRSE